MRNSSGEIPTAWILLVLVAIAAAGISIQFWMADVSADAMNPAHENLLATADWMVKASIGAILGFSGARLAIRNGQRNSGQA